MIYLKSNFGTLLDLVSPLTALAETWEVPGDFDTIQEANDAAADGDTILVGPGNFAGALVTKSVEIQGIGQTVIDSGPVHGSGMIQGFRLNLGSDGATISHLTFEVDLAIMNGAAVGNVTVSHCTFLNSLQAISNWRGNGWEISHNVITDLKTRNGGGIGILIGDYTGGTVEDNVVSHNKISGVLDVGGWFEDPSMEKGGYAGSGIVLYADFRWARTGSVGITNNRVVNNKVSLVSNNLNLVDVVAIELTDTQNDGTLVPVIFDNAIGFNDMRRTALQLALTPSNLDAFNFISRNLGNNRGHGLHPSVFGPGGN